MLATVEMTFKVRDRLCTSYTSFPVYSDEIEKTLSRELEFLKKNASEFSLSLTIKG